MFEFWALSKIKTLWLVIFEGTSLIDDIVLLSSSFNMQASNFGSHVYFSGQQYPSGPQQVPLLYGLKKDF